MKRYNIEMNGDDQIIEESPNGEWVKVADLRGEPAYTLALMCESLEKENGRLRGRIRELEAELSAANSPLDRWREGQDDRSRLATATALIRDWTNFDFDCPDEHDEDTGEEGEDGAALERLYERSGAFLAGQPAAPCSQCHTTGAHKMDCTDPSRYSQPAAPTRTEAAESRLAASIALLRRCNGMIITADPVGRELAHDIRDALDDQPSAPALMASRAGG